MSGKTYTHEDHANPAVVAVFKNTPLGIKSKCVQVQMHHVTNCAQVIKPWTTADGLEMFQLMLQGPIYGRLSLPANRVRQCSGVDGRCTCVPFDLVPDHGAGSAGGACDTGAARAGASALPDGNHGETFPECAE